MTEAGEQMDLINVGPEHSDEIIAAAKVYVKYRDKRIEVGNTEVEKKKILLGLIKAENLKPLEDGKIRLKCVNYFISITPTEYKLKVQEDDATEE